MIIGRGEIRVVTPGQVSPVPINGAGAVVATNAVGELERVNGNGRVN
jgi:hypothetical protein